MLSTRVEADVDFEIPKEIQATLDALDDFIEREIEPLERQDGNIFADRASTGRWPTGPRARRAKLATPGESDGC